MTHFKSIMVAFDGSSPSMKALETAESLTKYYHAHLTVVFVYDRELESTVDDETPLTNDIKIEQYIGTEPATDPGFSINEHSVNEFMAEYAPEKVLSNARRRLTDDINAYFETLVGNPSSKLVEYAEDKNIDLIIMGHRGLNGFKKFMMGSVSSKVSNKANCSVFVVR